MVTWIKKYLENYLSGPSDQEEIRKVLVAANNHEAAEVISACNEAGIPSVAIYSEDEKDSLCVKLAPEAVCIGPARSSGCYQKAYVILSAGEQKSANAIHLCGGPLSGDDDFARLAQSAGFIVFDSKQAEGNLPDLESTTKIRLV